MIVEITVAAIAASSSIISAIIGVRGARRNRWEEVIAQREMRQLDREIEERRKELEHMSKGYYQDPQEEDKKSHLKEITNKQSELEETAALARLEYQRFMSTYFTIVSFIAVLTTASLFFVTSGSTTLAISILGSATAALSALISRGHLQSYTQQSIAQQQSAIEAKQPEERSGLKELEQTMSDLPFPIQREIESEMRQRMYEMHMKYGDPRALP